MSAARVVAVDLGASSGRVHVAVVSPDGIHIDEVARFANGGVRLGDRLHWDVLGLYRGILDGLGTAGRSGPVASVGIDSWAVDYGLVRGDASLVGNPAHHRDGRTAPAFADIVDRLGAGRVWARTGIALQPFNTLYQLATDRRAGYLHDTATVSLIPDLLAAWLSGAARTEVTNASTTQLLDPSGAWDAGLLDEAGVTEGMWAPFVSPGETVGELRPAVAADLGLHPGVAVTAVASHDTASAVVAVPATAPGFAYLSCGTWSLVGVETDTPVLTEAARRAGFTNERGIDGTTRFLRNVMGLWLLQESVRTWEARGARVDLGELMAAAGVLTPLRSLFDVDRPELLSPGDMPARIALACDEAGYPAPEGQAATTRAILDSLAVAYRRAVRRAEVLTGVTVSSVHLVGGGVHNTLLCQLTADACGVPVVAGPVEAAALGNALVQARALGVVPEDRWALRRLVASGAGLARYEPSLARTERFDAAERCLPG